MSRWFHLLWVVAVLAVVGLWLLFRGGEVRGRGTEAALPTTKTEDVARKPADLIATESVEASRAEVVARDAPRLGDASALPGALGAFHGRVLDVDTGEPIPWLQLEVESQSERQFFTIGEDARFVGEKPLPADAERLEFNDPWNESNVRSLSPEQLEPDVGEPGAHEPGAQGWLARIAVGPTYRLKVPEAERNDLEGWQARLIESSASGRELRAGDWLKVHDVAPPFLRYDNPWKVLDGTDTFHVEVMSADGTRRGRSDVLTSARGVYPELVVIHADDVRATVRGRVVDTLGHPKGKAIVTAAWLDRASEPSSWPAAQTGDDGSYELQGLASGAYRICARPRRGEKPATLRVELAPGVTTLPDLVVPAQEPVGMIEGKLVSASGEPLRSVEHVHLRALDGQGPDMFDVTSPGGQQSLWVTSGLQSFGQGGELVFEFNEVPAGRFELSVVDSAYLWDPPARIVEAPDETVVFKRRDDALRVELFLRAFDADSKAEITPFLVQIQLGGTWNPESFKVTDANEAIGSLTAGAPFAWTVFAPGYRPVRGDEQSVQHSGRGLDGSIALTKGYGARFVLRDIDVGYLHDDENGRLSVMARPPVTGATILADGKPVARSNDAGVADVALERAPQRFDIAAPGWRVIGSPEFQDGHIVGESPDVLVWLIAE